MIKKLIFKKNNDNLYYDIIFANLKINNKI